MKLDYSKSWVLQKLTAIVFLLFLVYLVFSLKNINLKTLFLKAKYGDASGVRGAAILSRQNST